jgi:hypothetical protein
MDDLPHNGRRLATMLVVVGMMAGVASADDSLAAARAAFCQGAFAKPLELHEQELAARTALWGPAPRTRSRAAPVCLLRLRAHPFQPLEGSLSGSVRFAPVFDPLRHNQVLVASHLPMACFLPFAGCCRMRLFRTDLDRGKIARRLERRGIGFSLAVVDDYCRSYGSNFLDLEPILERWPTDNFDLSCAAFRRLCQVRRTPWRQ